MSVEMLPRFPFLPSSLSLLLLLSSFLIASLLFLFTKWSKLASTFPPGPLALPILGHLHLLGELPHRSFHRLSKVYGPLIGLRLGSVPVIVAHTPDLAREILQTNDLAFASRMPTAAAAYIMFQRSDIGFTPFGPYWRLMRQVCVTDLFSKQRLEAFRPIRQEEVSAAIRSIWKDSGGPITVSSKVASVTNNIISRMTLGKSFSELMSGSEGASLNIVELITEIFHLLGAFNIGDFIPCLQWMDLQGYVRRMKIARKSLSTVFQKIIDDRRELRMEESDRPKDLLDVLLSFSEENQSITDDNIKAILTDMYAGGTDTASVTIEWALAELLRNPTGMKKLQAEIESVVGKGRLVQESDIPQLPYLRAVVKETMRLRPPSPLITPHQSTKPCEVAGYQIPAETVAYVNAWAIGRDPSVWERPLEFWPERFEVSDIEVRGNFELLPFGAGRRGCPGWALGMHMVHLTLGNLVQGFEWSQIDSVQEMREMPGLTAGMAQPLVARATPRLPAHAYAPM